MRTAFLYSKHLKTERRERREGCVEWSVGVGVMVVGSLEERRWGNRCRKGDVGCWRRIVCAPQCWVSWGIGCF